MSLNRDLIFLILQYFNDEGLNKTAHMLEHEMGIFFNMSYFEELVLSGNWDEAERYLSGFIIVEDDKYSRKIYFELWKQKFLEALDKHDRAKALDILVKDLKVFSPSNKELYGEMTQLLTFDDFRKHSSLSSYGDVTSARLRLMNELKNIINASPLFHDKLEFPEIDSARLRRLVNQSLNWQHIHCPDPQPFPSVVTLYTDHQCTIPNHPHDQSIENNPMACNATSVSISPSPGNRTFDSSSVTRALIFNVAVNVGAPCNSDANFKGVTDSNNTSKTSCTDTLNEKALATILPRQGQSSSFNKSGDLPRTVGRILNSGSSPTSMDFHPVQHTTLLVGTDVGDIDLWEVISGFKLVSRKFRVSKIKAASITFWEDLVKNPCVSVNCILWSPNGSLFGVAYSKHIVHLFSYDSGSNIRELLEIDAHVGGVNDLAFSRPNEQLYVITCGDDKLIQVWDATTGAKQYTFEGHEAPVYSVYPHVKERIPFLFSTSTNGEIKAWLYDDKEPRVAYNAPGQSCTRMAYSTDGKRLFSCGTNKDGESYLVEWEENEGFITRTFAGLSRCSSGVVRFDTSNNRILAAGNDHLIKFWNVNNVQLLTTVDADGSLPPSPHIRFNKNGTLLAVFATDNVIKILANDKGLQLLQISENHSINASGDLLESFNKLAINPIPTGAGVGVTDGCVDVNGDTGSFEVVEPETPAVLNDILELQNFSDIKDPSQCQSLRLSSEVKVNKIYRLIYTSAGNSILALGANGIHLLWKWSNDENSSGDKASTKVAPELWLPKSGILMTNDLTGIELEMELPCFALSKNDSYVVSTSGGIISLFNVLSFKKLIRSFMPPPPTSTCIVFYPQDNNIIAIGMDDSTILIYNVRVVEVIKRLKGHSKRITGLAFSNVLNILVSSGMDDQMIVWNSIKWEKEKSIMLDISINGWFPLPDSEFHVQFHPDQTRFLAVHETQLAIYEPIKLKRMNQWNVGNSYERISHATFSCDGQSICAGLRDGTVLVFGTSDLLPQCAIHPTAYLPSDIRCSSNIYPFAIAANPREPNQFALGLTNGSVVVVAPLDSEGTWGVPSPVNKGSVSSMP